MFPQDAKTQDPMAPDDSSAKKVHLQYFVISFFQKWPTVEDLAKATIEVYQWSVLEKQDPFKV